MVNLKFVEQKHAYINLQNQFEQQQDTLVRIVCSKFMEQTHA